MPNKTLIISDVHLSDGSTKYSWFKDDSKLKGFLNETANRSDVKELVLLGDIFDLWLYPVNTVPLTAQQIIQHWNNGADSVVSALKACANKLPNVFYINGNHDMAVTAADIALISPKIKWISSEQYNATHANTLHLEHGNLVDMFNAPDISNDPIKGLPFGYFITRLVATANNHIEVWKALSGQVESYFKMINLKHLFMKKAQADEVERFSLHNWLQEQFDDLLRTAGKELIEAIIELLIGHVKFYDASFSTSSKIILPDGTTVTVGEVKSRYHKLLFNWYKKLGSLSALRQRALASTNLDWYATQLLQQSHQARLVAMGHTHTGRNISLAGGQYTNSGCWIDKDQATYVEIDSTANPKAVVKTYPGNMPLMSVRLADSPESAVEELGQSTSAPQFEAKGTDPVQ